MRKLALVALVTACLAVALVSCGDDDGTGVQGTGSIEVTLNMTGSDLDPDGCRVVVDGRVGRAIEARRADDARLSGSVAAWFPKPPLKH